VFKGEFAADFCTGVNVFIGGNGTGKTTLLKEMYDNIKTRIDHQYLPNDDPDKAFGFGPNDVKIYNI
jgi:ABC-type multidrug transport system ATPase subunit